MADPHPPRAPSASGSPNAPTAAAPRTCPILRVGGFELEVCGPTAHEIDDTWDADWLAARVACAADGAELTVPRIVLTSWSIRRFLEGLLALEHSLAGCAFLAAEGPQLALCATGDPRTGHITVRVDVTPDCAMQGHWFRFDVDQTFLAGLIDECRGILTAYPTHEME